MPALTLAFPRAFVRVLYTDPWRGWGGGGVADVSGGENLDLGVKTAALCRTDSVLVSSSTWPKAFLVRSLVGPSFLGFVLFILPRGSSASVERAGWEGVLSPPAPSLPWLWGPSPRVGDTGHGRNTVRQPGWESR